MGSTEERNQHGTSFVNMAWVKEKIRRSLNGFTQSPRKGLVFNPRYNEYST